MQTSSKFFIKNLFSVEQSNNFKKQDQSYETHILQDPLRMKEELTPWSQINPKYNFDNQRLIKFKQKVIQDQIEEQKEEDIQQTKEIKPKMVSNLFNFYKNTKQKKKPALNKIRSRNRQNWAKDDVQNEISWTLPPLSDKSQLEEVLLSDKESKPTFRQGKKKEVNKQKQSFIQSISIGEYLQKLKEKEKVFSSLNLEKNPQPANQIQEFISHRKIKNKHKGLFTHSIDKIKDLPFSEINLRYAPIRNQDLHSGKKKFNLSPIQSLEQSFQIYKKAAEIEVQEPHTKKFFEKQNSNHSSEIGDKKYWKNKIPLISLLTPPSNSQHFNFPNTQNQNASSIKKYNTISYDSQFSHPQQSVSLPRVSKHYERDR